MSALSLKKTKETIADGYMGEKGLASIRETLSRGWGVDVCIFSNVSCCYHYRNIYFSSKLIEA